MSAEDAAERRRCLGDLADLSSSFLWRAACFYSKEHPSLSSHLAFQANLRTESQTALPSKLISLTCDGCRLPFVGNTSATSDIQSVTNNKRLRKMIRRHAHGTLSKYELSLLRKYKTGSKSKGLNLVCKNCGKKKHTPFSTSTKSNIRKASALDMGTPITIAKCAKKGKKKKKLSAHLSIDVITSSPPPKKKSAKVSRLQKFLTDEPPNNKTLSNVAAGGDLSSFLLSLSK